MRKDQTKSVTVTRDRSTVHEKQQTVEEVEQVLETCLTRECPDFFTIENARGSSRYDCFRYYERKETHSVSFACMELVCIFLKKNRLSI